MMRFGLRAAMVLPLILLAVPGRAESTGSGLCGLQATAPAMYRHVVWIWFESHGFAQVVGSRAAPFMNRTLIPACGLATNYHAIAHPSLPNYIAATSGLSGDALGRFAHDCNAVGPCRIGGPSLFGEAP